jgi:molybdopterin-containing oxidoreductase family iron-sulfur binding subunit
LSRWQIPQAHYLESWGDDRGEDGTYVSLQPMILPLYGGLSEIELLAALAGLKKPEGPELVQETFKSFYAGLDFDRTWQKFVHDGFLAESGFSPLETAFNTNKVKSFLKKNFPKVAAVGPNNLEIVFTADPKVNDGRFNNNGWMQEVPDPITKITWDNAALISSKTAAEWEVKDSDVIKISWVGREIEAPVYITPGQSDYSMTLPLGYGRTEVGKVGRGTGFSAYPLRTSQNPYYAVGAKISKTGRTYELSQTQEHNSMEGRELVREARLDQYQEKPDFAQHMGVEAEGPPIKSYYKNPALTGKHQWGMAIDLNTCTGCNACVVACQSENNIPIVGKDQVRRTREMHWIRIDRYFTDDPEDPQMVMEPVTCMHCENAPCETVCPVNATVHSEEGLNVMTYNRCIGTRYCANNCPYKVRRFNYFDYNKRPIDQLYKGPLAPAGMPETLKMQKNPNVTVRMRGVIEKCSFCVQRIEAAKIDQLVKAGDSPDTKVKTDTVKTACQQVCPAEAITFGDISDPASKVSKLKAQDRNYGLLYYLATMPRVSYLAKIRNPNMRMPGAEKMGLPPEHHE